MDSIKENFEKVVKKAQASNAEVELLVSGGESFSASYNKENLESFKNSQSQMAGFRVIKDGRQGYAYTENLAEDSLMRTFQAALDNAEMLEVSGDTKATLLAPNAVPKIEGLQGSFDDSMDDKLNVAKSLVAKIFSQDSRITAVPYNSYSEVKAFKRILNSKGVDSKFEQSYCSGFGYALAKEGEVSKMGGEGFFARNFNNIAKDIETVAQEAARKATAMLTAKTLKTGNYAVVIERDTFQTILTMLESYFSAKDLFEGKSLLKGKVGHKISSEVFSLVDDPFEATGTSVRPFDDEGAASKKVSLINKGVFENFLTNSEYAQKMNLPHTAHAARSPASQMDISASNLVVEKGQKTLEQLLANYDEVVYLTGFTGGLHAGFKESTGDFSMPGEGFLYRKGVQVGPVDNFVVSGNVLELLGKIVAVGNEYGRGGSDKICPDVLVSSLSFAGASE